MHDANIRAKTIPWLLFAIAAAGILLDQVTKHMAQAYLNYLEVYPVTSFFYLTLRFNEGAAFSLLANAGGWQRWFFTALAVVISVVLVIWMTRIYRKSGNTLENWALCLILSGALGNLYDRVVLGHVVDFIVFHYHDREWPAFNVADMAICGGAILMVWDMIKGHKKVVHE